MDIKAIKKNIGVPENNNKSANKTDKKLYKIAIRLNTTLHNTVRNYLASMHASADYSHASVADILRYILVALENKKLKLNNVKTPISGGDYIEFTLRCTLPQKQFWQSLPAGNKIRILEKAIIAFLQK